MLGWILLALVLFVLFGSVGFVELSYRLRKRRERRGRELDPGRQLRERELYNGRNVDCRERRRLVQRELDRLRR